MVFRPGQSGNPAGHNRQKIFVDALHAMITHPWEGSVPELPERPTVAHAMVQRLILGAFRDDWKPGESLAYMQEICDRAYGKPKPIADPDEQPKIQREVIVIANDQLRSLLEGLTTAKRTDGGVPLLLDQSSKT